MTGGCSAGACNQSGKARRGVNNHPTVPSAGGCRCNSVSASTAPCSPYFNYNVRYSESADHDVPCIANQYRTLADAKHYATVQRQVRQKCSFGCPSDDPGDVRDPCNPKQSKFCTTPGLGQTPCAETNLGTVVPFSGSMIHKTALAGTIGAHPFVQVQASDQCGMMFCPNGTRNGTKIAFNEGLGTWTPFFDEEDKGLKELQFQSQDDADVILGDGIEEPLFLDRDYLASHLIEILGPARLAKAGWIKL